MTLIIQYLITLGWALTGAISTALALAIALKLFHALSPINEWEELQKGNMAVATVLSSVVIGVAFVVGIIVMA